MDPSHQNHHYGPYFNPNPDHAHYQAEVMANYHWPNIDPNLLASQSDQNESDVNQSEHYMDINGQSGFGQGGTLTPAHPHSYDTAPLSHGGHPYPSGRRPSLRHQALGHRRSSSQPPEEVGHEGSVVFHRGSLYLNAARSSQAIFRNPYPNPRATRLQSSRRPGRPAGRTAPARYNLRQNSTKPTSIPRSVPSDLQETFADRDIGPGSEHGQRQYGSPQPRVEEIGTPNNTSSVGDAAHAPPSRLHNPEMGLVVALDHLEKMSRHCEAMTLYLGTRLGNATASGSSEIESKRAEQRILNAGAIDLEDIFMALPRSAVQSAGHDGVEDVSGIPVNGMDVKALDGHAMNALLASYDIPFTANMFLHEKKMLYLRFIGVNAELKHKILD